MDGNPQVENGFTRVANEIMEALARYRIPGERMQCLLVILRQTYGWRKKSADISLNDFAEATGIKRSNVARALNGLKSQNIISVLKSDTTLKANYQFNKQYKTWKVYSKTIPGIKTEYRSVLKSDNPTLYKENKDITPISPKIKKRKTAITDEFQLNSDMKNYALDNNIFAHKVFDLFEAFKDHHIARGSLMIDWGRAWQTWVRNAPEFSKWAVGSGKSYKSPEQEELERWRRNKTSL